MRPFPWASAGLLEWAACLENICLFVLILYAFMKRKHLRSEQQNFLLFAFFFTLSLFALIGWVTPVVGAIVRYKVPALPFLVGALLSVIDIPPRKILLNK
jgi:hypothetical protein